MSALDLVADAKRLLDLGLDKRKVWTTVLFHSKFSDAHTFFNHAKYGMSNAKTQNPDFLAHVTTGITRWFRSSVDNGIKSRERALRKETEERENWCDLTKDADMLYRSALTHPWLLMAHDMPVKTNGPNKIKEGGPKDFFIISPWQMLATISQKGRIPERTSDSIERQRELVYPKGDKFIHAWLDEGQPMTTWDFSSAYNYNCDPSQPKGSREYFFTIDIDGVNMLTKNDRSDKNKLEQVIANFEGKNNQDAILTKISEAVRLSFEEIGVDGALISWHKTIGWKPSYRGYVVGPVFKDVDDAKHFSEQIIMPKLLTHEWFQEAYDGAGVFDSSPYRVGCDRCLGSAKLNASSPETMRFLEVQPMGNLTDDKLMSLFQQSPNQYILTVLGWIYPHYIDGCDPTERYITFRFDPKTERKKRKNDISSGKELTPVNLSPTESVKIEEVIRKSLKKFEFENHWEGQGARKGADHNGEYVEMLAKNESFFCMHKKRNGVAARHTQRASKIKFRMYLDAKGGESHTQLLQNCWNCSSKFGKVCPVQVEDLRSFIFNEEKQASVSIDYFDEDSKVLSKFGFDLCIVCDDKVMHMEEVYGGKK